MVNLSAAAVLGAPYWRVDRDDIVRVVVGRALIEALVWTVPVEAVLVLTWHGEADTPSETRPSCRG